MNDLKNKKILMFAPKFFNYENIMKEEMERQGAIVHLFDERNNPSSFEKILIRKMPSVMKKKINEYYLNVCEKEKEFIPDYVLFVSPETINLDSLKKLRNTFPNSKFILYMYDSIENKNAKYIYSYFDKCLSFDSNDCKRYGFIFRPLFFNSSYKENSNKDFIYDLGFIGSIHSDRAKILYKIARQCDKQKLKYFYYLYVPGKMMLFIRSILDKNVRALRKYIHLQPLDKNKASEVLSKTNYIIDINHPRQVGLTMRTIEMLGLERKIITTNENIKYYDFYNPNNQIIVNRNGVQINSSQFSKEYYKIDSNVYLKYSLEYWTKEIFS